MEKFMKSLVFVSIIMITISLTASPGAAFGHNKFKKKLLYGHKAPKGILDGTPKTFMVTGYSTSAFPPAPFGGVPWPAALQAMLNEHAGDSETYYVISNPNVFGDPNKTPTLHFGTPIATWTDICPGRDGVRENDRIHDALAAYAMGPLGEEPTDLPEGVPPATIMLAQQSLQWAMGDCSDGFLAIEGPDDEAAIQRGADAINYYAMQFLLGGIEKVYLATHIFKAGDYPLGLQGEEYAMERALDQGGLGNRLLPGPMLFSITEYLYPEAYYPPPDPGHPNQVGAFVMALYWYRVLAGKNAKFSIMKPLVDDINAELEAICEADESCSEPKKLSFRHFHPFWHHRHWR